MKRPDSRRRPVCLEPMSEETVKRLAYIFGDHSAAALALAEMKTRRERGEDIGIFLLGQTIVVGPPPPNPPSLQHRGPQ
jgi:hypothetical protein